MKGENGWWKEDWWNLTQLIHLGLFSLPNPSKSTHIFNTIFHSFYYSSGLFSNITKGKIIIVYFILCIYLLFISILLGTRLSWMSNILLWMGLWWIINILLSRIISIWNLWTFFIICCFLRIGMREICCIIYYLSLN